MIALFFLIAFALVAAGLGWSVVARLDRGEALTGIERLVLAFAVGSLAFYLAVFAVGPFRLDRFSMGAVALAAGMLSVPGLRAMGRSGLWKIAQNAANDARHNPWLAVLWLSVLGIGASSLLQGLAPPNDYDSLMYHITIPQLDVERGRIAPAWDRQLAHAFFPAGMHHLYRFALVLMDAGAAQMIHGLFGLVAAAATAAIARRLGANVHAALLAAAMFLATRAVIWEMGTAEVDVASATWLALVMVVYLAWRDRATNAGGDGLLVLLGMTIGGGILTKYHGGVAALAIGAVLLVDAARGRMRPSRIVLAPAVALALFTPHLIRAYILTGNPIFPLFNARIVPGGTTTLDDAHLLYGTGRGLLDLLTTPFTINILPMHYFDGMMLGAPYLLAFAPLALLARRNLRYAGPVLGAMGLFYLIWFYRMGHQVRFLLSLFPLVAAFAAIGATALWDAAKPFRAARTGYVILVGLIALNQAMFVGIYAALRLPVALGLRSAEDYHARTPTMQGAFYGSCMYVRKNLRPGERYISLIRPHSFYCPQASAQLEFLPGEEKGWLFKAPMRPISLDEFIAYYEVNDFRFVVLITSYESRRNLSGTPIKMEIDYSTLRFGQFIADAVKPLAPLTRDSTSAVYDGRAVLAELKKAAGR